MTVADYLNEYAQELGAKIDTIFEPLHRKGYPTGIVSFGREPLRGQVDAIAAVVKAWKVRKVINFIGATGSGKTFCSALAIHNHARGKPYRAVIMCPPHLVEKWVREILNTIPSSRPRIIERYTDLVRIARSRAKPTGAEYLVFSESMAKLGPSWRPAVVVQRERGGTRNLCPGCHTLAQRKAPGGDGLELLTIEELAKRKHSCDHCGEPLWQWEAKPNRWPVAGYIHRHMKGMIDYAVIDEQHIAAAERSAVAIASGQLITNARKVLTLTATHLNGYAHGAMHMMFRGNPQSLAAMGFEFGQTDQFSKRYGRLEKTVTTKVQDENRVSRGSKGRTTIKVRPGIMPTLFGDHMIGNTVFLSLEDVSDDLPEFSRDVIGLDMDPELAAAYTRIESESVAVINEAMNRKDMQTVSRVIRILIGYPDHPHGYGILSYTDEDGELVEVMQIPDLPHEMRAKDEALLSLVNTELDHNRKVWVFCEMTQTRDVQERMREMFADNGIRARVLRSQHVPTRQREQWISDNGPWCDVIIAHPKTVAVGLDFFQRSKSGGYRYNFPTLVFYQTPMETAVARQASGRAFRIGQTEACKVIHLHYRQTLEQKLVKLLSSKIQASEAIDGRFTEDGLSALSDAGESMGLALAKSLVAKWKTADTD